jgi:hypothetical protein
VAVAAAARTAQAPRRLARGSMPRSHACGPRTARVQLARARSSVGHITPKTRPPDRHDAGNAPAAAATCLRRKNGRLSGIICRRLQITAVLLCCGTLGAHQPRRADQVDLARYVSPGPRRRRPHVVDM